MTRRIPVAQVHEVPVGEGRERLAGDRIIALYHLAEGWYALDGICPHAGGPLGEGKVQGCIVTCPWHGWQFDVTTGQHCLTATLKHPSFPVHLEGDQVLVELPD